MISLPSWRSTLETWAVQGVVAAGDPVVAGGAVAEAASPVETASLAGIVTVTVMEPLLGRPAVVAGLSGQVECPCPTWMTLRPSQPWLKGLAGVSPIHRSPLGTSTTRLACSWILQQQNFIDGEDCHNV